MNKEERLALKKAEYEGSMFKTNNYGDVVVLEYNNASDVTIKFLNTGNIRKTATSELRNGEIRDKLMPYKGVEMSDNFKIYSYFKEWCNKQVGFDQDNWQLDKDILSKDNKVYSEDTCCFVPPEINCAVTNNKSVRGEFPQGVIYNCTKTRYRARIQRGDKWESLGTYDTPEETFYVYKPVKEAHIKSLAEKWKDKIDPRVYDALMSWEISIDD